MFVGSFVEAFFRLEVVLSGFLTFRGFIRLKLFTPRGSFVQEFLRLVLFTFF